MCIESIILSSYGSPIKNIYLRERIFFSETLEEGLTYPYNEGVFTNTLTATGEHLKNIILLYTNIPSGTYINTKIIGGCIFKVGNQIYDSVISVQCLENNPDDIFGLKSYKLEEIKNFIITYHRSKGMKVEFSKFITSEQAIKLYKDSYIRFERLLGEDKENIPDDRSIPMERKCDM